MTDYTLDSLDPEFAAELKAWDALSDEAFAKYELVEEALDGSKGEGGDVRNVPSSSANAQESGIGPFSRADG
jgi:hypothetical protein